MGDEFCTRCGQPRLGAFRYCRGCGFDFDVPPPPMEPDPERPTDAPTQTSWVVPSAPGAPLWSVPTSSPGPTAAEGWRPPTRRRRWPRYAAVGVAGLLGLGAIGNALSPEDGDPTGAADPTATPTARSTASSPPASMELPAASGPTEPGFGPTGPTETATVTRITDGDTIRVRIDGADVPVRYIGVDTPEPDDPDPTKKALADAATAANAALVEGRDVVLERDVSDSDQFDRLLRDVWVEGPDGELIHVGLALVRTGFAQVSTYPPDVKYVDLLLDAQDQARTAEAGLWAPSPTPRPTAAPIQEVDDSLVSIGTDESTKFRGSVGDYTWSSLVFDGDRMTFRWDVRAEGADCRVGWRLDPDGGDRIRSTVRVDAGDRERDNRRYDVDYTAAEFTVTSTCPTWLMSMQTSEVASSANCDDSYVDVCIPPYPPDLDCGEIAFRDFEVRGADPHGFDRDNDGVGCES
jgi:micrococcal nuclease